MPRLRVSNLTSFPFRGWVRATIDDNRHLPSAGALKVGDKMMQFVLGRKVGTARVVDLKCELEPSAAHMVMLDSPDVVKMGIPLGTINLPTKHPLLIGGHPMTMIEAARDGAALTAHLRDRIGDFVVNVWLRWYPGEAVITGEALVVHSNPMGPNLVVNSNPEQLKLSWHGMIATRPNAGGPEIGPLTLLEPSEFADGQGKAQPFAFLVTSLLDDDNWQSVLIKASWGVSCIGDTTLLQEGQPRIPASGNEWGRERITQAFLRLRTWDWPVCGPSIRSSDTGRQEDQLFHPGSEVLADDGAGCEFVRYLSAAKLHAERPCNHFEMDGRPLDIDAHPRLILWDGRPFVVAQFNDNLGKAGQLTKEQAHGRWGPDVQHFLFSTLVSSARQTASPMLQLLLFQMTSIYLLQRTVDPARVGTTGTSSAREWGYEGLFVVQVQRTLEDRTRADRVLARGQARIQKLVYDMRDNKDVVMVFVDDQRLGNGRWCVAWQEALGSYGIDLLSEFVGNDEGRKVAHRVASKILAEAWVETPEGGWLSRANLALDGQPMPAADGSFNAFGMCLAPETIMRSPYSTQAQRDRAISILQSVYASGDFRWVPQQR